MNTAHETGSALMKDFVRNNGIKRDVKQRFITIYWIISQIHGYVIHFVCIYKIIYLCHTVTNRGKASATIRITPFYKEDTNREKENILTV